MMVLRLLSVTKRLFVHYITTCCSNRVEVIFHLIGVECGSHLARIYLEQSMSQTPLVSQNLEESEGFTVLYRLLQFQEYGPVIW